MTVERSPLTLGMAPGLCPLLISHSRTWQNEQTGAPTFIHFGDIENVCRQHDREPFIGHSKKKTSKDFKCLFMTP